MKITYRVLLDGVLFSSKSFEVDITKEVMTKVKGLLPEKKVELIDYQQQIINGELFITLWCIDKGMTIAENKSNDDTVIFSDVIDAVF